MARLGVEPVLSFGEMAIRRLAIPGNVLGYKDVRDCGMRSSCNSTPRLAGNFECFKGAPQGVPGILKAVQPCPGSTTQHKRSPSKLMHPPELQ